MAITQTGTGGIKDDAVTAGKIPANAVGSSEIADEAVTLAKLEHGTSSNDGKFLRANNGADPSFETVSIPAGTTINNNADNRVITGSGTANTLNAESGVVIDSSGKVGIGTTSPVTQLHSEGSGDQYIRLSSSTHNTFLQMGASSGETFHEYKTLYRLVDTDNGERMRIDSSGNVGVGTSSPASIFHTSSSGDHVVTHQTTTSGADIRLNFRNDSGTDAGGIHYLLNGNALKFITNASERFQIDGSGNVICIGSSGSANTQRFTFNNSGDVCTVRTGGTNASNHGMIVFRDGNNTFCGQITSHGTNHTTSYGTSSDYRLKENESLISDGITRLKKLKPYKFKWKSSGNEVDGFFAHEAQTVVPEAVTGTKDEVDSNNDPIIQQIDQSKLVPLLTAALQEAIAKIETLETKVAALEAA